MHAINKVAADCVMVGVVAIPIAVEVLQVEIVALYRFFAVLDDLYRSLIEGDGRQARKGTKALLTTGITSVDLHTVDDHGFPTEATYGIYDEEGIMGMGDAFQFF